MVEKRALIEWLAYARHWFRFRLIAGLHPHMQFGPASRTAKHSIRFHRYGFVTFWPGRSLSISWRDWVEAPCRFEIFVRLKQRQREMIGRTEECRAI